MDATTRLKRSDNVTFQNIAGEAILIRLDTGTYFSLNKAGTEFWEMLDGQQTIEQHAAALAGKNNRIVQAAVDGLNDAADRVARDHGAEAQVLIDDLRGYVQTVNHKYHVDTPRVVSDLLEIAQKMAADKLVDIVR
ncbi:MAG TPA: PqqD family protein [Anaerolineae bacterium]|nr:PqqD family protein [Anaerolineae bacterium]